MNETTGHPGQPVDYARCDVVIIGYGPVGMITAALLAQEGLRVIVIERFAERYKLPRAGHMDGETMRGAFQRLGIAEELELVSRPMLSYELVTPDFEVLASMRLGEEGTGWKDSYLFYQPELEEIVHARGVELGVTVMMNTTALAVHQDESGVAVEIRRSDEETAGTSMVRAKFLLGADGANSFVRGEIGAIKRDLGFLAVPNLVVDFEHNDPDRDVPALGEVRQILDIRRPTLAGRWSGGRWSRLEFRLLDGESPEEIATEVRVWELLAQYGLTPELGRIDRRAVHVFESSIASEWRDGRVLLIGDAAHTMPPFLGQGMCSGVRDGLNLAWKLAAVIRGNASLAFLDTYESERAPHVTRLIQMVMALGDKIQVTDPEMGRRRDEALRAGRNDVPPPFPRLGHGIVRNEHDGQGTSVDGRPSLQARVASGKRVDRLDEFVRPGWRLITRHAVPDALLGDRHRHLLQALAIEQVHISRGAGSDHLIDIDAEYDLWFRTIGSKAVLVRPDNYVFGGVKNLEDVPGLLDDLKTCLERCGWKFEVFTYL